MFARGNDKRLIYLDDRDRRIYLAELAVEVERRGWLCMAYCLMPNHVHLLLETPEPNLAPGMQRLHGDYALLFNRRYRRSGHLFQGRYGSKRVRTDGQLMTLVEYLAANPVKAELSVTPSEYVWGSVAATVGAVAAPPWLATERLLGLVGGIGGGTAERRYAELVSAR